MPKFEKSPPLERKAPPAPPPPEPAGLDAFVARAAVTPPPETPADSRGRGRTLPSSPMPVRFPPHVKQALERLSLADQRSQQQIMERIAFPAILEAAGRLG